MTSNTCVYDGGLTIPNPPSRTGYTFTGWRVRPQTNFAALKITTNGIKRWGIGKDEAGNFNICWYGSGTEDAVSVNCSKYYYEEYNKELQRYEWKVAFDWGNIYGVAHCSAKSGNIGSPAWSNDSSNWKATYSELESVSGDKKYCWCQATGYNPSDDDTIYGPSSVLAWIFRYDYGSGASCLSRCANYCSYTLATSQPFRLRLFREVQ